MSARFPSQRKIHIIQNAFITPTYRPGIIMPHFSYRAFGLAIQADASIAGLIPQSISAPDIQIHLGAMPQALDPESAGWRDRWQSDDDDGPDDAVTLCTTADERFLLLRYADGTRFVYSRDGTVIWATWSDHSSASQAATYLLGPVIGFALRLQGTICLHASIIVVAGRAIALVGPAGAGKSTTAAAFALSGGQVIADDIAVLQRTPSGWLVHPAIPGIRLWDDSVEMLLGRPDALPLLAPGWEKRFLDLRESAHGFHPDVSVPLGAVYLLESADQSRPTTPQPTPQRLRGRDALIALVSNTYANVLLDTSMRHAEFTALTEIASTVPVWRIVAPEGRDALDRFCATLAAIDPSGAPSPDAV